MLHTLTDEDDWMPLVIAAARHGIEPRDVRVMVDAVNTRAGAEADGAARFRLVLSWINTGSTVGAYRAMLGSWYSPQPGWSADVRTVAGCAMPHAAATTAADGQVETHAGWVDVAGDGKRAVPALWCHRGEPLGQLVAYRRSARGADSLDVWITLDHSDRADAVLDAVDAGRVGLSVGVASPLALGAGQRSSRLIERQRLREVSLVPVERAAFGTATLVRRQAASTRRVEEYRRERAWAMSSHTPRATHRVAVTSSGPVYYH